MKNVATDGTLYTTFLALRLFVNLSAFLFPSLFYGQFAVLFIIDSEKINLYSALIEKDAILVDPREDNVFPVNCR